MKLKFFSISIVAVLYIQAQISAQTLLRKYVQTNGPVNAIVQRGDTTYIGGSFSQVGINLKKIARFKPGSATPDLTYPDLGENSSVNAVTSDGQGGCYLGGYFDMFDNNPIAPTVIIHITSQGNLDSSFGPVTIEDTNYQEQAWFYALKVKYDKLYVGGRFTSIQGVTRYGLAALNPKTGELDSWKPDSLNNGGGVQDIQFSDSCIIIQGSFSTINGLFQESGRAAFDINTGKCLRKFPTCLSNYQPVLVVDNNTIYEAGKFNYVGQYTRGLAQVSTKDATMQNHPWTNGAVEAILPDGKGGYFIGGNFTWIGNKSRNNLAHVLYDGSIDSLFNYSFGNYIDDVKCLATDGSNLYAGGYFTNVNGSVRNGMAAFSLSDGTLTGFNPNVTGTSNPVVNSIVYHNGILYLAGKFSKINNIARSNAGAVTVSNTVTSWNPDVNNLVYKIIPNSNYTSIFMCGSFKKVNAVSHPFIAKISTATGTADAWLPSPNNQVQDMVLNNNTLYVSGDFTAIKNKSRNYLAALDTSNNIPTSFIADADSVPLGVYINAGKLYVVGCFRTIQNASRKYVARINLSNGFVDSWNSANLINPDWFVSRVYANDSCVIFGGFFYEMFGVNRNNFTKIQVIDTNFVVKNWSPAIPFYNVVDVENITHSGNEVFAEGHFSYNYADAKPMQNLIALNDSTGAISREFLQFPYANVHQMRALNNKLFFAGGTEEFYTLNGVRVSERLGLAAYDLTTNTLSQDLYEPNGSVYGLDTDKIGNMLIGGDFTLVNSQTRNNIAAFKATSGSILPFSPNPDNIVYALTIRDSSLFVGGGFESIGITPSTRQNLAAVNINTGETTTWKADANSIVKCIALKDSVLYVGGTFTSISGTQRNHIAAISTNITGSLQRWNPNANDIVYALMPVQDSIYVGGAFTSVNGGFRSSLFKCDRTNGLASSWSPLLSGQVNTLCATASTLYAGGIFNSVGDSSRNNIAAFDIVTDTLKPLNLVGMTTLISSALVGKNIYLGLPNASLINGVSIDRLTAVDTITGIPSGFNPKPPVDGISVIYGNKTTLFTGGYADDGNYSATTYFSAYQLLADTITYTSSTSLTFSNIQPTTVDVNWIDGSAPNRLVVSKQGATPSLPQEGKIYVANSSFGTGDQTAPGSYAVYNGPNNLVHVTNLLPNHAYTFNLFDYSGVDSNTYYSERSFLTGTTITPCPQYSITIDSSGPLAICPGQSVTLIAPQNFSSYLWSSGETTKSITIKTSGSFYVKATDTNGCKAISSAVTVTVTTCLPPTTLKTSNITSRNATLTWKQISCSNGYQYQYRKKRVTAWTAGRTTTNSKVLTGLKPSTTYQWRVLTICETNPDTVVSIYTNGQEFMTAANGLIESSLAQQSTFSEKGPYISPNPVGDVATLHLQNHLLNVNINLRDVNGKVLWKKNNVHDHDISISMLNVPNGMYFLEIQNETEYQILKLIKIK